MRVGRRLHISWPTTTLFRWPRGRRRNIFSAIRRDLVNGWTPANDVRLSLDYKHKLLLLVVVGVVQRVGPAHERSSSPGSSEPTRPGPMRTRDVPECVALDQMTLPCPVWPAGFIVQLVRCWDSRTFKWQQRRPALWSRRVLDELNYLGPVGRSIELVTWQPQLYANPRVTWRVIKYPGDQLTFRSTQIGHSSDSSVTQFHWWFVFCFFLFFIYIFLFFNFLNFLKLFFVFFLFFKIFLNFFKFF